MRVLLVMLALRERRARLAHRDRKVHRVRLALKDHRETRDHKARKEILAPRERKALKAVKARKVQNRLTIWALTTTLSPTMLMTLLLTMASFG